MPASHANMMVFTCAAEIDWDICTLLSNSKADAVVIECAVKMGLPHLPFQLKLIYEAPPKTPDLNYDLHS
jgi:hypothetical protein